MKKYVKLRDAGTIFHDASQDISVTGSVPTLLNTTKKVNAAIKGGILIEVKENEAKLAIAEAQGNKEEVAKELNKESDAKVAEVQGKLNEANTSITEKDAKIVELETTIADAKKAGDEIGQANKEIESLNKSNTKLAKDLEASKTALADTKKALAEANKKSK